MTDTEPARAHGAIAFLVLAALGAVTLLTLRPPAPEPADAPATTFSAERAMGTVEAIAGEPRPLGSPASDAVRDRLAGSLRAAGLRTEVRAEVGYLTSGGIAQVAPVENVVATLPGTDPTGAVLLVAHYDSVPSGPGAADDASSVAAVLETVRALRAAGPLRNDVVVLLTDGEERGLLGAQAFVADDPLRATPVVVLNWEARGTSGPSLMFQTSPGNARLVAAYAAGAPHPAGDSSLAAAYGFLPNDTDFSSFLDAGRPGLNFAFIGDPARYHTAQDSPAQLSRASLQHHGSSMLGLTAELGNADLAPYDPAVSGAPAGGDATYFPFLGAFVVYPGALVLPVAVGALLVVGGAVAVARHRRLLTLPGLLAATASLLLPLVLAAALGQGLWAVLVAIRPAYGDGGGFLHRPLPFQLATLTLAVLAVGVWTVLLRRRIGPWALGLGAVLWPAALGVVVAVVVPGASFLFALPAMGLGAGALVGALLRGPGRAGALTIGAVPAVVLLLPFTLDLFDAGGIATAGIPAVAAVLLGAPLVLLAGRIGWRVAPVPLVVALALVAAGLVIDRPDAEHPQRADLAYLLDADTGTARWISRDLAPAPWTAAHVPDGPDREPRWAGTAAVRSGPAPALDLPAPAVTPAGAGFTVTSPRGAGTIGVRSDVGVEKAVVTIDGGRPVTLDLGGQPADLRLSAVPAGGVRIELRPAAPGPLRLQVRDETVGVDAVPGFTPRPPELTRSIRPDGDAVVVTRSVTLPGSDDL